MGTDVECIRAVGIIPPDIWELLQGGGTGNPPVQSRDMGNVIQDLEDHGRFQPQCGPPDGKYVAEEVHNNQTDGGERGDGRCNGG